MVKVDEKYSKTSPVVSATPSISNTYVVFGSSGTAGTKLIPSPPPVPLTDAASCVDEPCFVSLTVELDMVLLSIPAIPFSSMFGKKKSFAETLELTDTPICPSNGVTPTILGV